MFSTLAAFIMNEDSEVDEEESDSQGSDLYENQPSDVEDLGDYFELQRLFKPFNNNPSYQNNTVLSTMAELEMEKRQLALKQTDFYTSVLKSSGLIGHKFRNSYAKSLTEMIKLRELGHFNQNWLGPQKCKINNLFLPNHNSLITKYRSKSFCGIFNKDGSRFAVASQDGNIRLYRSDREHYQLLKTVEALDVGWSIIDLLFTPDQKSVVYSTWSSLVYQCPLYDDSKRQTPLVFSNIGSRFCIFALRFSHDGKELIGGANDGHVYVYDRTRNQVVSSIFSHEIDVNAVTLPEDTSELIYTGGDDGLVKVWDRRDFRSAGETPSPVGVLAGHLDGITYIDAKKDGRYLISNSKDQSIKLWDLRKFADANTAKRGVSAAFSRNWDYRWENLPSRVKNSMERLDGDTSIMTYRGGHTILKTLIRCRFSPFETTGERFIYTGCGRGNLVIYDALTGDVVLKHRGHQTCVRDASWHPYRNEIVTTSWDGMIRKWSYKPKS